MDLGKAIGGEGVRNLILILINLDKLLTEQVCDPPCEHQVRDEIVLVADGRVAEPEPGGTDATILVEGHISHELLPTDAVLLAAVTLHLDLNELAHLRVKVEVSCRRGVTGLTPESALHVVLERCNPREHWGYDTSIESSKLHLHLCHLFEVSLVRIVDVVEDEVTWGARTAIVEQGFKVVVEIAAIDEADVLVKAQLYLAARHEAYHQQTRSDSKNDDLT
jgi:hypothetical protein